MFLFVITGVGLPHIWQVRDEVPIRYAQRSMNILNKAGDLQELWGMGSSTTSVSSLVSPPVNPTTNP